MIYVLVLGMNMLFLAFVWKVIIPKAVDSKLDRLATYFNTEIDKVEANTTANFTEFEKVLTYTKTNVDILMSEGQARIPKANARP